MGSLVHFRRIPTAARVVSTWLIIVGVRIMNEGIKGRMRRVLTPLGVKNTEGGGKRERGREGGGIRRGMIARYPLLR